MSISIRFEWSIFKIFIRKQLWLGSALKKKYFDGSSSLNLKCLCYLAKWEELLKYWLKNNRSSGIWKFKLQMIDTYCITISVILPHPRKYLICIWCVELLSKTTIKVISNDLSSYAVLTRPWRFRQNTKKLNTKINISVLEKLQS